MHNSLTTTPNTNPAVKSVKPFFTRKKTRLISQLLALVVVVSSLPAAYAGHADGQIVAIRSRSSDGLVWINVTGPRVNKPACALYDYMMIRDENSETGKKQFAMLLQAHATGKRVVVYGTGNCSRWGDGESIDTVEVVQ